MRWKITAGLVLVLALLIPATPAVAETGSSGLEVTSCQAVVFRDIRELVTIDLATASDIEVRVLANQIVAVATANSYTTLRGAIQARLDGTADDLRAFLQTQLQAAWLADLRIAVYRTLTNAGSHVQAAADKALADGTVDALLAYLNHGLYIARGFDCAS